RRNSCPMRPGIRSSHRSTATSCSIRRPCAVSADVVVSTSNSSSNRSSIEFRIRGSSSCANSFCFMGCHLYFLWNTNGEFGSFSRPAPNLDHASMSLYDLVGNSQPESGTAPHRFGGKERIEDAILDSFGDSAASVTNRHQYFAFPGTCRNDNLAAILDCIHRIRNQVH